MVALAPGVDTAAFRPGAGGPQIREQLGLGDCPVVICVSRLVRRKGQDTLIQAWPRVLAGVGARAGAVTGAGAPGRGTRSGQPVLLLVGDGPYRGDLERLAGRTGVAGSVMFTGPVSWADLPAYYDAGDVFAMPCRTRRAGLDVEGLGMVYLEASATGLPVVGGDSGGAPDAILDGETGFVVPGRDAGALADRLIGLLTEPDKAAAMGERGAAWVQQNWRWELVAQRLASILAG
jgi:phosphatidylinositol alpha-1,6-mannosyltransferase